MPGGRGCRTVVNKKKRTVLVTGGASGLGAKVVRCYAGHGWRVICHFNSSGAAGAALKEEIEGQKGTVQLIQGDLSSREGVEGVIQALSDEPIDALVNNAGAYLTDSPFSQLSFDEITRSLSLALVSPLMLCGVLFPQMCDAGFGRIVNVSSIAAKFGGSAQSVHYGCGKRALEGITLSLGRDGAPFNVLVNTVRPGVIDTPFHRKTSKSMATRIAMIPAKRMGTPDEVAQMIYYLGSEENTFISRETVTISGGE